MCLPDPKMKDPDGWLDTQPNGHTGVTNAFVTAGMLGVWIVAVWLTYGGLIVLTEVGKLIEEVVG